MCARVQGQLQRYQQQLKRLAKELAPHEQPATLQLGAAKGSTGSGDAEAVPQAPTLEAPRPYLSAIARTPVIACAQLAGLWCHAGQLRRSVAAVCCEVASCARLDW